MKKLLILIFCLIFALPISVIGLAVEDENAVKTKNGYYDIDAPEYETDIALLVNADTDTVIYSKNADVITAPASLAKITTALVALSKCDDLQTVITCSEKTINSLLGTGSSIAGLKAGEQVTLEMLLYCLFLMSGNDAALAIAEYFGNGDVNAFVAEMNAYVKELGCKNTYFANPHGLDDETIKGFDSDKQNRTTASDMYLISKKALANDHINKISSKYGKTMPATNKSDVRYLYNTNPLLNSYSYYYYEGAVGLKTGTTDKAGCCLISSATKDGYTYISIAMKGNDQYVADGERRNTAYLMCRYMLRWAFSNVKIKELADTSYNVGEVAVKYGRGNDYVALVPNDNISAVVHKDIDIDNMKIEYAEGFPEEVDAPVKKGDVIGKADVVYDGVHIASVTLVAQDDVKKNYLWAMFNWLEKIMSSKGFIITVIIIAVILIILFFATKNERQRRKRRKSRIDVVKDYSKLAK